MRIPLLVDCNSRALVFYYIGNGSASFDPSITTSANVNVYWKPDDAPETVTSGTTHNFSYAPSAGSHRCVVRVAGGLGLVTAIDCSSDSVTSISNIERCTGLATFYAYFNSLLSLPLSKLSAVSGSIWINTTAIYGNVLSLSRTLASFRTPITSRVVGLLSDLPPTLVGELHAEYSALSGSLAGLPAGLTYVGLFFSTGITPASIAHLTAIRDIRLYSMWPSLSAAASVDIVIDSMWSARANYTYATPSLQIGGTNPAPTGNYIAPEEGPDWHNDGSKWIPLTPNAKAFDLGNDVNTEGFNTWTITKN